MSYALEITNLVKRYGGLVATNNLSFGIRPGESVGLIGPNGAGKTTVFGQIMGQVRPTSGSIKLFGKEISALPTPERLRLGVSRTYQVPRPFSELSVLENIRVGLMPNSIRQMIFGAPDLERERALGRSVGFSDADLERTPAELAMGDLRKLELARTMATGPKVMLLDEVFAGLSAGEIAQISELIQKMRQDGMTFLIVSHDLPSLEPLIDRAIAIERGTFITEGSFAEVIENKEVQASYMGG